MRNTSDFIQILCLLLQPGTISENQCPEDTGCFFAVRNRHDAVLQLIAQPPRKGCSTVRFLQAAPGCRIQTVIHPHLLIILPLVKFSRIPCVRKGTKLSLRPNPHARAERRKRGRKRIRFLPQKQVAGIQDRLIPENLILCERDLNAGGGLRHPADAPGYCHRQRLPAFHHKIQTGSRSHLPSQSGRHYLSQNPSPEDPDQWSFNSHLISIGFLSCSFLSFLIVLCFSFL